MTLAHLRRLLFGAPYVQEDGVVCLPGMQLNVVPPQPKECLHAHIEALRRPLQVTVQQSEVHKSTAGPLTCAVQWSKRRFCGGKRDGNESAQVKALPLLTGVSKEYTHWSL